MLNKYQIYSAKVLKFRALFSILSKLKLFSWSFFVMKKIALILLLGFGFAISPAIAQDEEEVIEYVEEEVEEGAEGVYDAESGDETIEIIGDKSTSATSEMAEGDDGVDGVRLEPLDDEEFADEVIESDGSEYVEETIGESTDDSTTEISGESTDYTTSDDPSDITRWNYTEKEIARKEEIRKRQAEREAEYAKSLQRRRSGLFFGLGMGFSDTDLKGLAGVFGGSMFNMSGRIDVMGIGIGGFAGYQIAFNEYSGIRAYGEFDYNLGNGIIVATVGDETVKADNNLWKALGNIDFYLEGNMGRNQTETLGLFFGLGAGYIFYKGGKGKNNAGAEVTWKSLHLIGLVVNYGIHTILGTNHRLEIFVRNYPFMRVQTGQNYKTDDFKSNIDAWIRYSYMF